MMEDMADGTITAVMKDKAKDPMFKCTPRTIKKNINSKIP